jgi:hypothetical protein
LPIAFTYEARTKGASNQHIAAWLGLVLWSASVTFREIEAEWPTTNIIWSGGNNADYSTGTTWEDATTDGNRHRHPNAQNAYDPDHLLARM